jgi:hypothetical protein
MRALSQWLYRVSRGRVVIGTAVLFGVFVAAVLPGQAARTDRYAAGVGTPDTSFWYSSGYLTRAAEAYGADGRAAYVTARLTIDVVWPLVYTAALATALSWLGAQALSPQSRWRVINVLPFAVLVLDYAENVCAGVTIARYPDSTPVLPSLAPWFTAGKWLTLLASVLAVLVLAAGAFGAARTRRRGTSGTMPP